MPATERVGGDLPVANQQKRSAHGESQPFAAIGEVKRTGRCRCRGVACDAFARSSRAPPAVAATSATRAHGDRVRCAARSPRVDARLPVRPSGGVGVARAASDVGPNRDGDRSSGARPSRRSARWAAGTTATTSTRVKGVGQSASIARRRCAALWRGCNRRRFSVARCGVRDVRLACIARGRLGEGVGTRQRPGGRGSLNYALEHGRQSPS